MDTALQSAITMAVASVVVWLFARAARQLPEVRDGAVVLRYSRPFAIALYVCAALLLGGGITVVVMALTGEPDDKLQRAAWIATPLCLVLGLPALLEPRVELHLDAVGIRGRTAWRGERALRWDEVVNVKFNAMGWFVLQQRGGGCLRVSCMLRGFDVLLLVLRDQLPKHKYSAAVERYQKVRASKGY